MIDILIPRFDPLTPRSMVENMSILALGSDAEYMEFVHDDVECKFIQIKSIEHFFEQNKDCGMAGFGGATGLGTSDLYKSRYDFRQLARINYCSNTDDAEAHGTRVTHPLQVAVLDGFCQIIRRTAYDEVGGWQKVLDLGIEFHMYDAAMACLMKRFGWEVWMLPIPCHHNGGRTSTTEAYDKWLRSRGINGDAEIHQKAHKIIYEEFRDVLPIRVKEG